MTQYVNVIPTAGGIGLTTLMTAVAMRLENEQESVTFDMSTEDYYDTVALLGLPTPHAAQVSFENAEFGDIEHHGDWHIQGWSKRGSQNAPGINIGFVSSSYASLRRASTLSHTWHAAVLWQLTDAALTERDVQSVLGPNVRLILNRYMPDVQRRCDAGLFASHPFSLLFSTVVDNVIDVIREGK